MADIALPRAYTGGRTTRRGVKLPDGSDVPQVRLPSDPGVRAPAGAFDGGGAGMVDFGKGLADFGASVARVSEKALDAKRDAQVAVSTARAAADLKGFVTDLETDTDYETYPQRFEERAKAAFEQYGQGMDEKGMASFRTKFEILSLEQAGAVRKIGNKRLVDGATADLDAALDGYAGIAANAVSDQQRADALELGRTAIRGTAEGGIISREEAGKRERGFLGKVDEITARQMIAADPEAAIAAIGNAKLFPDMDEKQRLSLLDTATRRAESIVNDRTRREEKREREAEKGIRKQGDEAAKELDALAVDGGLTREEVDKRKSVLSPTEYRSFLKTLTGGEINDNRSIVADMEPILGTPEAASRLDAAYQRGDLSTGTYRAMREKDRNLLKDDQPTSPYKSARGFLATALDPGQISNEPTIRQPLAIAQARALGDIDAWIRANPSATYEQAQEHAEKLLDRYQNVAFGELRLALPRPYRFTGNKRDVSEQAVTEAAARVQSDLDLGKITKVEAAREFSNLDVWERAVAPKPGK